MSKSSPPMSENPQTSYTLLAVALVNDAASMDQQISAAARLAAPESEIRLWLLAEEPALKRREIEELAELRCPSADILLVIHDAEADDDELQAALACIENTEVLVIHASDSFGEQLADELQGRCEVVRV